MATNDYIVIGGSSVSGTAIIEAIRQFDAQAFILTTTSSQNDNPTTDGTVHGINLEEPGAAEVVIEHYRKLRGPASRPRFLFYVPARGKVAMPAARTVQADVDQSLAYSVRPMLKLLSELQPEMTVGLSGFVWWDHMLVSYGAMTFTKFAMEDLAIRFPEKFKIIRAGMFHSSSVRGIAILVQRELRGTTPPDDMKYLYDQWKQSGKKFKDWFYDENNKIEHDSYQHLFDTPWKITEAEDLKQAALRVLGGEPEPIVNVIGRWVWTDNTFPPFPEFVHKMSKELLPKDLDSYFQPVS